MSYCSNCGGRLNDNGICPNCGSMIEANVTPTQKDDYDILGCVKAFFSSSPLKGVEKAARNRSASVWVTFGSLFVVSASAMSLAAFGSFSSGFFRELCGSRIASVVDSLSESSDSSIMNFCALTAHAAIISFLALILLTVISMIAFIHADEKPSLNHALNISAFALFPLSIAMLLAIPVALVSTTISIMLVIIGIACTAVSHYFGLQKASVFRRSPFLTLLCSSIVAIVILALCGEGVAMLLFR